MEASGFHKFSVVFNIKVPNLPAQFGALFHILKHEKLNLSMNSHHIRLMNLYIYVFVSFSMNSLFLAFIKLEILHVLTI